MKLKYAPLYITAIAGFLLNFLYYRLYFLDANYLYMSSPMAAFFIMSELTLWSFSTYKKFVTVILKYGLVIFSIFATLSSQFSSTSNKDTENAKIVYEKIDNSETIDYYKDQITTLNNRIDEIISQQKIFGTDRNKEQLIEYKNEKTEYEKKIEDLRDTDRQEITEVYTTSNIYGWFAVDLPEIIGSGLDEKLIRVLFQLFSSIILASMAPVSISMVRSMPWHKEPEILEEPEEKEKISDVGIENIVRMYKWGFDTNNEIMSAKEAEEQFNKLDEKGLAYKEKECEYVRKKLINIDMSKELEMIMEEL